MIHYLINELITELKSLNFVDRCYGVVYSLWKTTINEKGVKSLHTIPIYANADKTCNTDDYVDCVPNSDYKSCIYFETSNEVISEESRGSQLITDVDVRMVCWFNLALINSTMITGEGLIRTLIHTVLNANLSVSNVIEVKELLYRKPEIFNPYTYNEAEKQFLIYPYEFGAVDFNIRLIYDICDNEPIINPKCF